MTFVLFVVIATGTHIVTGIKAIYRARGFAVGHAKAATGTITEEDEQNLLAAIEQLEWTVE